MHVRVRDDLAVLSSKLFRAQTAYERARSRGDAERADQARLQLSAIIAERDRLVNNLAQRGTEIAPPSHCH
jgi:hypothetical protein